MTRLLFFLVLCCSVLRAGDSVRFIPVDLYLDSKAESLAAYQLRFSADDRQTKIVGIEGGEPKVFSEPPYYDTRAMQRERVILAAFSTASTDELPRGRTRIATIHVLVNGNNVPAFSVRIDAAANADGKSIPVDAIASERKTE